MEENVLRDYISMHGKANSSNPSPMFRAGCHIFPSFNGLQRVLAHKRLIRTPISLKINYFH